MQKNPGVERALGKKASCLSGMFHYLNEGKKKGLDGTCCVNGQARSRPDRKAEVVYGECKNWEYDSGSLITEGKYGDKRDSFMQKILGDSGRGDIGMHCAGIFKCDGDLLWCPSKSCTSGYQERTVFRSTTEKEMSPETARCAEHCVGDKKVQFRRLFTSRDYHGEKTGGHTTSNGNHIRGRLLGKKKKKKKNGDYPWMNGPKDHDGDGPGSLQQFGDFGKSKKKKKKKYPYPSFYGRPGEYSDRTGSSKWTQFNDRGVSKITTREGVCKAASNGNKVDYKDCMRCMDECSGCKNTCRCSDTDPITKDQMKAMGNINRLVEIFD